MGRGERYVGVHAGVKAGLERVELSGTRGAHGAYIALEALSIDVSHVIPVFTS